MFWYFMAGFISGVFGVLLLAKYIVDKREKYRK